MPELPEVETIRKDLNFAVTGKGIRAVKVWTPKIIKDDHNAFIKSLEKNRIDQVRRIGKLLIFELAFGDKTMLAHLRMTGQLISELPGGLMVGHAEDLPNKHTHVSIYFSDGAILHFNDIRTFGYLQLAKEDELKEIIGSFGIEPLTEKFIFDDFLKLFEGKKGILKSKLLDQTQIAGIGNIYADEICYKARIRPDRDVSTMNTKEIKKVFNACQAIIRDAIAKRGTSFSDYVDGQGNKGGYLKYLKVYRREGERCFRCGDDRINKIKVAGRGTHFCPSCQV